MILIFGVIWLSQFLYRHLLGKAATMRAETASGAVTQTTRVPLNAGTTPVQAYTADAAEPVDTPQVARTAMAARALPSVRLLPRRFSRRSLMPDQRAVQDAIVIAAILQPCHAHRPHDGG